MYTGNVSSPFSRKAARLCGGLLLITCSAAAWASASETTLYAFNSYDRNPAYNDIGALAGNASTLVLASDGNYYGVTQGGAYGYCDSWEEVCYGYGEIYRLSSTGVRTVLHSFNGADGSHPIGLTLGKDGYLYGTTQFSTGTGTGGTVFKMSLAGSFTTLHTFMGGLDGFFPSSTLIQAKDGYFYGTTSVGGWGAWDFCPRDKTVTDASKGCGVVYKISSTGTESVIWRFEANVATSPVGVSQGSDGYLYGAVQMTWTAADNYTNPIQDGFTYRLDTAGQSLTVLHSFSGGQGGNLQDGSTPNGPPKQAADGNFYGTTEYGGTQNQGTVYRMAHSGATTILHSFTGGSDGSYPNSGLTMASNGYLYGVAFSGGNIQSGTAYQVALSSGAFSSLYLFTSGNDGAWPVGEMLPVTINNVQYLVGTTNSAGVNGQGTVFRLQPLYRICCIGL